MPSQFRKVFGKALEDAWDDWIVFEHEFQEKNLAAVRQHPLTPTEPLTRQGVGSISRSFIDTANNSLLAAFRYPGVVAHIGEFSLDERTTRRITDIKGPMIYKVTSLAYDDSSRTLFYTSDNHAFRDLMAVNADEGKPRMLMKDARIGDLVFDKSTRSIWGLRHQNGFVTLVIIPPPYKVWEQVYTWPYGEVAYELDVSPDGSLLSTSLGEIDGTQYLRVFRTSQLLEGVVEHIAEFNFITSTPEGFVFSPDGRYLYGSSFYTGASNIFRYEIATGDMEAVSNAETGFFRPIPREDGSLMVFEYTGQGFVPTVIDPVPLENVSAITFLGAELARKHPVVKDWSVVGTLADQPFEEAITQRGKYHPLKELGYESGYPVIEGYRDDIALGYHLVWQDPGKLNRFELTASYSWDSPSDESVHVNAEYHALNWHALLLAQRCRFL